MELEGVYYLLCIVQKKDKPLNSKINIFCQFGTENCEKC